MLRSLGIRPEDYDNQDVLEVWPENTQAVNFFIEYCATQWRTGMGGATGLDYSAVIAALQWLALDKEVFEQVRCIERGALEAMAERRKREEIKG